MIGIVKSLIGCLLVLVSWPSLANCFDEAGNQYGIHPIVLKAIAKHESNLNPYAISRNTNGTIDVGLMQVNSVHLERGEPLQQQGFSTDDLLKPCLNVKVGAWLLARHVQRVGQTWEAVAAYHSQTRDLGGPYALKVQAIYLDLMRSR